MTTIERHNPARPAELVGTVTSDTPASTGVAVEAAAIAFDGWAATPLEERTASLRAAADTIDAALADDELPLLLCHELGKIIGDCRGEIGFAAAWLRWVADTAEDLLPGHEIVEDDLGRMEVRHVPWGVIGAITPWNAPIILSMLKVAPALATGNAIVVKPSPLAPLAVTRVLELVAQDLPKGTIAVVHGGPDVGEALIGHPAVAKVAFTGGLAAGQAIMRTAAERVKPVVLELGGNDAAILLEDADLSDQAIERLVHATFITSGQVCMAAKRVYVHRSRHDELVDRYRQVAADALVVGDPAQPTTTVGPLVTAEARDRVSGLVAGAAANGADVIELGTIADEDVVAGGWFERPTVVLGADDNDPIVTTEQFGPTVPILPFDTDDEAAARANAGDLGLAASVWSADEDRAVALARRIETGFSFINTHNRSGMALRAPFGGRKLSGFGREYGTAGILEYLQTHTINAPAAFRPGGEGGTAAYPSTGG